MDENILALGLEAGFRPYERRLQQNLWMGIQVDKEDRETMAVAVLTHGDLMLHINIKVCLLNEYEN